MSAGVLSRVVKIFSVGVVMSGLAAGCCGPCLVPCIPGVWPRPAPAAEARGAFLLESGDRIQFYRDGGHHRIELHRAAERDGRSVVRWELLDGIDVPATAGLFVCMGAAHRQADPAEYVAVADEEPGDADPVRFAWRIDAATQKLVAENPAEFVAPTASEAARCWRYATF